MSGDAPREAQASYVEERHPNEGNYAEPLRYRERAEKTPISITAQKFDDEAAESICGNECRESRSFR